MQFLEAIINTLKNGLSFSGRTSRREYWWFQLFFHILYVGSVVSTYMFPKYQVVLSLIVLILTVPSFSSGVRRLHDVGKSGWWLLLPFVNLIFLCQKSIDEKNENNLI